jgi:hypothetical protein
MSIVLPILVFAVGMGLFVRRMTGIAWCATVLWILGVIAFYYFTH